MTRTYPDWLADIRALGAEIERLTSERDAFASGATQARQKVDRLEVETARLREIIADLIEGEDAEEGTPQWYALRNARGALRGDL